MRFESVSALIDVAFFPGDGKQLFCLGGVLGENDAHLGLGIGLFSLLEASALLTDFGSGAFVVGVMAELFELFGAVDAVDIVGHEGSCGQTRGGVIASQPLVEINLKTCKRAGFAPMLYAAKLGERSSFSAARFSISNFS